jgi:phasin family protein
LYIVAVQQKLCYAALQHSKIFDLFRSKTMANVDLTKQADEALAVVKQVNQLTLTNVERLVDLNIESVRKYADVVLGSWKDALTISDLESSQKYIAKQGKLAQEVVKNLADDAKVVAEIGQEYASEVQKVVAENVANVTKKVA